MNLATAFVLAIVICIVALAVRGTYRMIKYHTYCDGCPNKGQCGKANPINCTIRND